MTSRNKVWDCVRWGCILLVGLALLGTATVSADVYTFTTDQTIDPNDATYDGHDIVVDGCVITINGSHAFESLLIMNNGTVTHTPNEDVQTYTIELSTTNDLTIEAGSAIDVTGRGYSSSNGPGQGGDSSQYGAGAAYGGNGGGGTTGAIGGTAYGSILAPVDLGSGGGRTDSYQQGGPGGGAIRLNAGGTLMVAGDIRADGSNGGIVGSNYGGGGSGGSIYITAAAITGGGAISAIGGDSALIAGAGGGGGGRIALYADSFSGFGWFTPAHGGDGYVPGGAGTTYFKVNSEAVGALVVDNNSYAGAGTPLTSPEAFDLALRHSAVGVPTEPMTIDDFALNSDSTLTHIAGGPGVDFTIQGNALIDPNTAIDVSGRGYPASSGPGQGGHDDTYASGAGYGGLGADSTQVAGGIVYGSITEPTDFGSGGGSTDSYLQGGPGGGAIRLAIAGTLTLNGNITANGNNGTLVGSNQGGGGSGGSVYINAAAIEGSGNISADGGASAGENAGGGGGGRIALYHDGTNTLTGQVTAFGGGATRYGGAGTIYTRNTTEAVGQLQLDNGGNANAWTPFTAPEAFDVVILNGAIAEPTEAMTIDDLTINTDGLISHSSEAAGVNLTILGDAVIDPNAAIDVSGRGYPASSGPGQGGDAGTYASGGGYGGSGADSTAVVGGTVYGSMTEPTALGSGGGSTDNYLQGGPGGGAIRLDIAGTLTLNGDITANGYNGALVSGNQGGGGSGGSVYISATTIEGGGNIVANGGDSGGVNAGGGGGGRIAIYHDNPLGFAGEITAYGGGASRFGGAGTIYIATPTRANGDLYLDNNGNSGAYTDLPATYPDFGTVRVESAAILAIAPQGTLTAGELLVGSSGVVTHRANEDGGIYLDIAGDVTVDVSGSINVSRKGHAPRNGLGAGGSTNTSGAGAGYGGTGGNGSNTTGGSTYGSVTAPVDLGSGGGEEMDSSYPGGFGGGAIQIAAGGTFTLEGLLTADGGPGTGGTSSDNGGGSGGSIWINADSLAGMGSISASGGNGGVGVYGGAGGGGRVAVYTNTNSFAGAMTCCGGTGYQNGGPGTIYVDSVDGVGRALILDNCGIVGAETDLPDVTGIDNNLIVRNQATLTFSGELEIEGDVTVSTEGQITHPATQGALHIITPGNVTIEMDGAINVSGRGYAPRQGPGAGGSSTSSGAGAGYGGAGGDGSNTTGGSTYGWATKPYMMGSGGGEETDGANGGSGGGAVRLSVGGTITVDGQLSARGGNGAGSTSADNGGGSGGSIWLITDSLVGTGSIDADGGNGGGGQYGGGGGGGRIAIYTCDMQMSTSLITATAGSGYNNGEDGTIEYGSSSVEITLQPVGQVLTVGEPVTLYVEATGDGDLSYQWRKDGVPLENDGHYSGVDMDTFSIDAFGIDDIGAYDVLVTDDCGPFASDFAMLTIPPDLDLDGDVDLADLAQLLAHYGDTNADPLDGDLDGDRDVDLADLAELLAYYGLNV